MQARTTVPFAVISILLIDVGIWLFNLIWASPEQVFATYGFIPAHPRVAAVVTSMFLHAGFWHLAGNMWFLWMFGRRVENSIGPWLFILAYFASGLGGSGLHFALNRTSAIPCVGASGAISGIVGCFFVFFPRANFDLEIYIGWWRVKQIPSQTTGAVGAWLAEQTLLGLLSQAVHFSAVAFWAHVGGFLVGVLSALLLSFVVGDRGMAQDRQIMSKADLARLDLH